MELLGKIIKKIILIDRFTDSTIAYQRGLGVKLSIIRDINKYLWQFHD